MTRRGVRLGEARLVEREIQWTRVRNGRVELQTATLDRGLGVRVLKGGWGFAASSTVDPRIADRAVDLAEAAQPLAYGTIEVGQGEPTTGSWRSPVLEDPFAVPAEEKLDLLIRASEAMEVDIAEAATVCIRRTTHFASTEGSAWDQEQVLCGASVIARAVRDGLVQVRSFPKAVEGDLQGRGWESVRALDLVAQARRVSEEARQLLDAPRMPSGEHTIILDGSQLSLQIHESVGHPTEGDRVLGEEMSLAGGSFLQPAMRGERFGSELVNLYADATEPGAAGSFGWDDEGSPATRVDLVRQGRFVGWLSGRESSARLGTPNAAAMRADTWSSIPIVRMVNVNLEPGEGSLEDLIRRTEHGFLVSGNRSWSIDQLRLNFQFGCEAAWEIRDGELGQLHRDPVYTGITPEFWGRCDAICGPEEWHPWGWAFCGKGDPMQIMHVAHGCAPARFRQVRVL